MRIITLSDVMRDRGYFVAPSLVELPAEPVLRAILTAEHANDPSYALETMAVWHEDEEEAGE